MAMCVEGKLGAPWIGHWHGNLTWVKIADRSENVHYTILLVDVDSGPSSPPSLLLHQ